MTHHFFAYIARMRFINRWALMRNSYTENIQEHSHQVAVLAHALALIRNRYFGGSVDAGQVAVAALYHDATEILTGDMPTPVKYSSIEMQNMFHGIEDCAAESLLAMLPEDMKETYRDIFFPPKDEEPLKRLVKAADKISALIKCIEEAKAGNREFDHARRTIEEAIGRMDVPEAKIFLDEFLPSYEKTLDEISR